jgi:hypothetical protein
VTGPFSTAAADDPDEREVRGIVLPPVVDVLAARARIRPDVVAAARAWPA